MMPLDPVQTAAAVLASVLRGTPNDAHLDILVNELDRLQGAEQRVQQRDAFADEEEAATIHWILTGRAR